MATQILKLGKTKINNVKLEGSDTTFYSWSPMTRTLRVYWNDKCAAAMDIIPKGIDRVEVGYGDDPYIVTMLQPKIDNDSHTDLTHQLAIAA